MLNFLIFFSFTNSFTVWVFVFLLIAKKKVLKTKTIKIYFVDLLTDVIQYLHVLQVFVMWSQSS